MGRVLAPYGVKGWIKVAPFTAAPDALTRFDRWWIGGPDGWEEAEVAEAVRHGANVVARLARCSDRDQAALLRGREVALARESLPETPQDEYYWADLLGLAVRNLENQALGRIERLLEAGANQVLVVRGDEILEHVVEAAPLYVSQFEDFGRTARGDGDAVVTLADSRGNTAALLAVLEAARSGHTVLPAS